jgi:hypothetical protein
MLQFVAEVLLQIACAATGHGVLWAVTLGRWKPSWHTDVATPTTDRDNVATIAGVLFWAAVGVGVWLLFFR